MPIVQVVVDAVNLNHNILISFSLKNSPYTSIHKYDSFAPLRENASCLFFADGENYFEKLYEKINQSQQSIFITDWWLSPQLYLIRPVEKIKRRKQNRQSVIKISLERCKNKYFGLQRTQIALTLNSEYTKNWLQGLHYNIKVMRHPKNVIPLLWSHHEKMIVIDQKVGFLGGLDICYGRWDSQKHVLTDEDGKFFPDIDYSNSRIKDFVDVTNFKYSQLNRKTQIRMPWHDIGMMVEGEPVKDMCRHFIQYWNFAKIDIYDKNDNNFQANTLEPVIENEDKKNFNIRLQNYWDKIVTGFNSLKNKIKRNTKSNDDFIINQNSKTKGSIQLTFLQKQSLNQTENSVISNNEDKCNFDIYLKLLKNSEKEKQREKIVNEYTYRYSQEKDSNTTFQRTKSSTCVPAQNPMSKSRKKYSFDMDTESSQQYIQMLENLQQTNLQEDCKYYIKNPNNEQDNNHTSQNQQKKHYSFFKIKKNNQVQDENHVNQQFDTNEQFYNIKLQNNTYEKTGTFTCQMLRSSSSWSLGLKEKNHEMSIQLAYIDAITQANKYIYIENQFFISCTAGPKVKNQIAQAILNRIKKAALNKEAFKVIIIMPLLPGFEGEVNDSNSGVMKCQLHWEYTTISRGGNSLIEELRKDPNIVNVEQYIMLFGLRQHGTINNLPVTEIIYVHSKLMIVDDSILIMGSANINDRSMLGTRDSEIAMKVEDQNKIECIFGGQKKFLGKSIHEFRKKLYMEHFGVSEIECEDALNDQLNENIYQNALRNTEIYREVFACYPDDTVLSINKLEEFQQSKNLGKYFEKRSHIIGNAVLLPLKFLQNENLNFKISQKEYYVPDENFT
ncbi:phospholipase d1, putative [Ichthyophthirius multifiliis]|uniref:phospholipase D n=1 Tax=Ichthyophthirius multifiliis TaxID=5932 RepID=G0R3T5_ICHMU|nr:phospholipase d1, putative [Ichthyophthirius multifiliis]EGR27867.1 phospholipase d1, putative [Ichthyophthirius multifiliis]|eukprot:XP_004027212.1 phospholipase d1, putative [Ichthyophthirius multifiliis]